MTQSVVRKKKYSAASNVGLAVSYVFLIVVALIVLLPIIYIVLMAFNKEGSLYSDYILPQEYSLKGFIDLFTTTDYLIWYKNTLILGLMNAVLVVLLVTPTSYALSRLRFKGRKNFLLVFLVLQMFPGTLAMVAYYVLLNMLNLLNSYLGLTLVFACTAVPASTFMMKGYFDTMSRSVEEAAMLDGATQLQCVIRIVLPIAKPMLGLICLFGFAAPFGDYMLSKILISDPSKYTLALGTYMSIFQNVNENYSMFAAASILSSLPMTIVYVILQKVIVGGLKGAVA